VGRVAADFFFSRLGAGPEGPIESMLDLRQNNEVGRAFKMVETFLDILGPNEKKSGKPVGIRFSTRREFPRYRVGGAGG